MAKVLNIYISCIIIGINRVPLASWVAAPQPPLWLWLPARVAALLTTYWSPPPHQAFMLYSYGSLLESQIKGPSSTFSKVIIATYYNAIKMPHCTTKKPQAYNKIKFSLFSSKAIKGEEIDGCWGRHHRDSPEQRHKAGQLSQ